MRWLLRSTPYITKEALRTQLGRRGSVKPHPIPANRKVCSVRQSTFEKEPEAESFQSQSHLISVIWRGCGAVRRGRRHRGNRDRQRRASNTRRSCVQREGGDFPAGGRGIPNWFNCGSHGACTRRGCAGTARETDASTDRETDEGLKGSEV
ncbi:hypothetical protein BC827DRAFT_1216564 [Russula dissimulans]|nr:hypothetical protein BC827DRAFT_1216564 [Russula dissimulans]